MFRKFWLKLFVGIIVFQMIMMPLAPVLAEEINFATTSENSELTVPVLSADAKTISTAPMPAVSSIGFAATSSDLPFIVDEIQAPTIQPAENSSNSIADTEPTIAPAVSSIPAESYVQLMRRLGGGRSEDKTVSGEEFSNFVKAEKEKLDKMDIDSDNRNKYYEFLEKQERKLKGESEPLLSRIKDGVKKIFGRGEEENFGEKKAFRVPKKPAGFNFNNDEIKIQNIQSAIDNSGSPKLYDLFNEIYLPAAASADDQYLPTLNDVWADDEAMINGEIEDLAADLKNNPVNIFNFVRNNISYEPYFGAKKGSVGCLREKVCNDVDAGSLTIALLRAAGIPARYKKSVVEMNVDQIKSLLGVDELKTAYIVWAENKVPVYLISASAIPDGVKAIDYDFSNETGLGVEWVFVEAYYDYDERGANIDNILSFVGVSTTAEMQDILSAFHKKQWIPMDVVVKKYNRVKNEIVHDTANFNTQNFWNSFLQYQGSLSPVQKYAADLKSATGKDINNVIFQSTNTGVIENLQILPPTLPYYTHVGEVGGSFIQPVAWSNFPDDYRAKIKISLRKEADDSMVLEHTFYGNEINNIDLNLYYEGATDSDKQLIENYGGIAYTPSALVDIKPYFEGERIKTKGDSAVKIGDALVLKFEYAVNGAIVNSDEKFSIAGNSEGIAVSLSKVLSDPFLDNNSKILLAGNAAVARKYLEHLQTAGDLLQKSLDYRFNVGFERAVVTQNRILSEVDGVPTTFDFKGLSIDSATYINDWSNRGNILTHRKDFRLLWGEEASYYEGQLFNDITGLTGISTVRGLQYAYAHPESYTVHTITSANENEIDALNLSDNTKQNMHAAVQDGDTVITPDKPITDQNFVGVLYVVLKPAGCGTYAIGEQVGQNGGWTTDKILVASLTTDSGSYYESWQVDNGNIKFIYRDKFKKSISCSILISKFFQIITNKDSNGNPIPQGEASWKADYGWPCIDDNVGGSYKFGDYEHRFLIATDGAKFWSPSRYNYWKSDADIVFEFEKIYHYSNGLPESECTHPMKWQSGYCFIDGGQYDESYIKPYWGTYVYEDRYYGYAGDDGHIIGLGVYNPEQRMVHKLDGRMYEKYVSPDKIRNSTVQNTVQTDYVPALLGYPTNERSGAALSPKGVSGSYQQFTNGTMYEVNGWLSNSVYIVYGQWNKKHNDLGGTGGIGFPESDVGYNSSYGGNVIQKFENKICYDDTGISVYCQDKTFSGNFKNGMEGIFDSVFLFDALLTINKDKLVLADYQKFVQDVDGATDNYDNRKEFCNLYMSSQINSIDFTGNIYNDLNQDSPSSDAMLMCIVWPESIGFYQSKKSEIQDEIDRIQTEISNSNTKLLNLQDAMQTQVSNATYGPTEWLGYFAVDIASLIYPVGDLAVSTVKDISVRIASRYATELASKEVDRKVFATLVKDGMNTELKKIGIEASEEVIEDVADQVTTNVARKAGSKDFTQGGNLIKYKITTNNTVKEVINEGGIELRTAVSGTKSRVQVLEKGNKLVIYFVERGTNGDPKFHMSNLVIDQFLDSGYKLSNLKTITLDTVINQESINLLEKEGKSAFLKSKMGSFVQRIIRSAGKSIDGAPIVSDIIYDNNIQGGKYFNVIINIK